VLDCSQGGKCPQDEETGSQPPFTDLGKRWYNSKIGGSVRICRRIGFQYIDHKTESNPRVKKVYSLLSFERPVGNN